MHVACHAALQRHVTGLNLATHNELACQRQESVGFSEASWLVFDSCTVGLSPMADVSLHLKRPDIACAKSVRGSPGGLILSHTAFSLFVILRRD